MSDLQAFDYGYQVGGTIAADSPVYVERSADSELLATLESGKFCYVFNSRQMGKSSLRVRTQAKLLDRGWACASIDLTNVISDGISESQFYNGLIAELTEALDLDFERKAWLAAQDDLSPVQQFGNFVAQVVLGQISQPIAIFIDEIDSTLRLKFSIDPFFARIRSFYNQRSEQPAFQRLTFCLVGVAAPSQLIRDRTQTPFNIGEAIELSGLPLAAALGPLGDRLPGTAAEREQTLREILDWTGGQPFLTQRLCALVRDNEGEPVATLVQREIVERWQFDDPQEHFKARRDRLLEANPANLGRRLGCYQRVLASADGLELDSSEEELELRLVGLVRSQGGRLRVYNRIYRAVFDSAWVAARLAELRPYESQLRAWIESGRLDQEYLLHGTELDRCLKWCEGKRLSPEDEDFFRASQQLALRQEREIRQTLEAVKTTLEEANKELAAAQEKASKLVKAGQLTLITATCISLVFLAWSAWLSSRKEAFSVLERRGLAAIERFKAGQQLESLADATRSLKDLRDKGGVLTQGRSALPAVSPFDAVQVILGKIHEYNQLQGHADIVTSANWSPDGKTIASSSHDNTLQLWNALSGQRIAILKGHSDEITSLSWSPDSKMIVTGSRDYTVKIWSVVNGKVITTLPGHVNPVMSVSWSPDGKKVASGSRDNTVKIWSIDNAQETATFQGHRGGVMVIAWSPKGETIASGGGDGSVKLWNVGSSQVTSTLEGHSDAVTSLAWSPDGTKIATGSNDQTIKLWNINSGQVINTLQGHSAPVTSLSWNPDGATIASAADNDNTIKIWNTITTQESATLQGHSSSVTGVHWGPDGTKLVSASSDKTIKLWNVGKNRGITTLQGHSGAVTSLSWSPDGHKLASGSSDSVVNLWSVDTGRIIDDFRGYPTEVIDVKWNPTGNIIAVSSSAPVKLWNVVSNEEITLQQSSDNSKSVDWSPDGTKIATVSTDKTVRLWDVLSRKEISVLTGHMNDVTSVDWSPDGTQIATGSTDQTVKLWDAVSHEAIATMRWDPNSIGSTIGSSTDRVVFVSWNTDGTKIASGGGDGLVRIWDAVNLNHGIPVVLQGNHKDITTMGWSPDGKTIATGSSDNTVKLWHVNSRQVIATLQGHNDAIMSVAWSPDGQTLATGSLDNTVKLWPLWTTTLNSTIDKACAYLKPYLTNPDHPERNTPKVCDYPPLP